ncbi:hypothetical protein FHU33_2288 [Blastococcus colisei]|uniref:Uncharacterized protein n=1 Tax=Blastococcus colisei TaxID=1564162 RepID=A0A543PFN2_9ACTN|nr:hypothetical protein [Blastococcus colisei]TQN42877.1 hypothetical protein FHU33_2288 [Blastococcus colisei]
MTTPLPTGPADALDVRADDELSWLFSLDPSVIAVLGGVLLVLLVIAAVAGWLVLRRVQRSPVMARGRELTARGRELGVRGATAVAARRLPPGQRRTAAELQLEIARARGHLRRQVATARAAGAHLGDVPSLLSTLEAEGGRLEQRLRQRALAPSPTDQADLETEARAYLDMLADVCDAVLQAERAVPAAGRLTSDVADAVTALRAHTTAYQELTTPPVLPPLPPVPAQPMPPEATPR